MRELLEAGVHFGHQTRRWNPKMRRYIFGERGGIYLIDLTKTQELLVEAHEFARNIAERNGTILFVGTKKQAQNAVTEHASRVGMPYVSNRWLGGLLTNWRTISDRIAYLHDLRRLKADGQLALLPSKERIGMEGDLEKLESNLGGVADMKRQPDAVFVIDMKKELLAVRETHRLGVPVIGLVDTNADPDEAEYVIPGNDDAIRSCDLIARVVADGIAAGRSKVTTTEMSAPAEPTAEEPLRTSPRQRRSQRLSPMPRPRPSRLRLQREETPNEHDDQRLAGEAAARRDGRGDDGLQARARRDERRPRRRPNAPPRARHGVGRQARRPRDDRRPRRLHRRRRRWLDHRHRLRDGAGLEERRVRGFRDQGAPRRPRGRPERGRVVRGRAHRAHREARREHRRRGAERFEAPEGNVLAAYAHPPANKIGVLVELEGGSEELARQLAMHISFAAPEWTTRDDVPAEVVSAERSIYTNTDEVQSKPEAAREKIVDGMLNKRFFAAVPGGALVEQAWIHEPSKTVGQALAMLARRSPGSCASPSPAREHHD